MKNTIRVTIEVFDENMQQTDVSKCSVGPTDRDIGESIGAAVGCALRGAISQWHELSGTGEFLTDFFSNLSDLEFSERLHRWVKMWSNADDDYHDFDEYM